MSDIFELTPVTSNVLLFNSRCHVLKRQEGGRESTRVHRPSRRCHSRMAVRGTGAAVESRRIGCLLLGNADAESFRTELRDGLRKLGYVEGQNINFDFRSAEENIDLFPSSQRS